MKVVKKIYKSGKPVELFLEKETEEDKPSKPDTKKDTKSGK